MRVRKGLIAGVVLLLFVDVVWVGSAGISRVRYSLFLGHFSKTLLLLGHFLKLFIAIGTFHVKMFWVAVFLNLC